MRSSRWTPVVAVAFAGLVACGGGADQQQAETGSREADTAGQEAAAEQAEPAAAGTEETSVALTPKNQSGIRGEAVVALRGDSIRVRLSLTGLEAGTSYPAHVHKGTCRAGGGVATALTSVTARDSTGTSATTFAATAVSPDSAYYLQAHLSDGTPAACGDVPAGAFGTSGSP